MSRVLNTLQIKYKFSQKADSNRLQTADNVSTHLKIGEDYFIKEKAELLFPLTKQLLVQKS